ncbi:NAD(P)/FAD-dependent oxidoreductase [Pantoea sp. Ap-967]|uniref:phytoene desaturase family protein n=1 Tax=Pantoea sp. Ap-967 TaxID=2608362 RepID=UPI0014205067|nr:NAD(P)/FAD-dependent oxidoreductase [Pantoea sp. Ap-967]NIE72912.1 NAD(P)/FAD-dependent oxidoreductase [Pantoea sp. Ap-967]
MTVQEFDAVFVGAGHNSLVCANYLARAGLNVLLLESRKTIGGACTSEELVPGGTFSSCSYIQMMLSSDIISDLELKRHGLSSTAPAMQEMGLWDDGQHVMLWQEIDKTLRSIEAHHKNDGEGFMRFATRLKRFGDLTQSVQFGDPPSRAALEQLFGEAGETELFQEFMEGSTEALLTKYIESDRLRGLMMFMGLVSTWGSPHTPGTAYVYGYHAVGEFERAFGRYGLPAGGMGMITQSLLRALVERGGEVRVDTKVDQILIESGRAVGVRLASGEVIRASMVVSGTDPTRSLVNMLPDGALPPAAKASAEKIDQRGSMARIHLLVDALPDYVGFTPGTVGPQHQGLNILGPSPSLYEKAWEAQQKGEFPDDMIIEALIPSVTHPGLVRVPGTHTLSLGVQQLPFDLAHGDWDSRRDEWADKVLEIYFRYAPNMRNHILGRHVITPLDLHRTYGITRGNINHMSMIGLENLFDQRPTPETSHYRTPIPGYYLCGAGSHPGGGVTGMPGHNSAQRILADLAGKEDDLTQRKFDKADRGLIDGILKTDVGQKLGYKVARSRIFRGLTERLSK